MVADASLVDADRARAVALFQGRHAITPDGAVGEAHGARAEPDDRGPHRRR